MNHGVSTVDPALTPEIDWGESYARTDINPPKIDPVLENPGVPWTTLSELGLEEDIIKRYPQHKPAGFRGTIYFLWNDFPQERLFSDLKERSPSQDKKTRIYKVDLNNSTNSQEETVNLNKDVESLLELADEVDFEDGMESEFSKNLISFIMKHANNAIEILAPIFINEKVNAEIISESLRWIGRIEHQETENIRLWLLERCLFCSSIAIRDGATLGLASMNDPSAIYFLRKAIEIESTKELCDDMKEVLLELESPIDATSFKKNQEK